MKKIIITVLLLLTYSCSNSLKGENDEKIIEGNELQEIGEVSFTEEKVKQKINWDENVEFTYCDSIVNYNESDTRAEFFTKEDVVLLTEKTNKYSSQFQYDWDGFSNLIYEYCKSEDGNKFIFVSEDKLPTTLGRYDKQLDVIEKTQLNHFVFRDIDHSVKKVDRNYGDTSLEKYLYDYKKEKSKLRGFGKRNKNIIEFKNYGGLLIGIAESAPGFFSDKYQYFDSKTVDYCNTGLTPAGKLSVCFADVFYDFDFMKNEITESRICSYYVDDGGNIQTLEKCFDINQEYKGYSLKAKAKGIDFYQDDTGELSLLQVDLSSAKISFGGVNTLYKEERIKVDEGYIDDNGIQQIPELYETKVERSIEYENENTTLERFNRSFAGDFTKKYKNDGKRKNVLAFVNGQFFNQLINPTLLSFPVKSEGQIINSHVDNNKLKRTLVIDSNSNAKILKGYEDEYLKNKMYKELIVGFSPKENARKEEKIGRTYIGVKDNKKIVFFIAKNKTQKEMEQIIGNYGIQYKNIIMMDGGPSSQFAFYENKGPGSQFERFYGNWKVPHFFVIYTD